MFLFSTAALLVALATQAQAAPNGRTFAVNYFYGNGPLVTGRMDPIVSPGVPSGHEHMIMGGSNFALKLNATSLLGSRCTTSTVAGDKSAYWVPTLYFQDPTTRAYEAVGMLYMKVYYFFEATDDNVVAFPPGLQIFVGNASTRVPPYTGGRNLVELQYAGQVPQPVQWTCPKASYNPPLYPPDSDGLHGYGMQDPSNAGAGSGFPDQYCDIASAPMRADIHFPSCYDPTKALDDYKHNMAFPIAQNGKENCLPGWVHVPHMFYEVYWDSTSFSSRWTPGIGKQPFVLSNGDSTGYSLHADFVSGWETDVLQQIIDNCNTGNDGMDGCPGLIGGKSDQTNSCHIANAAPDALFVKGSMFLPGGLTTTGFGAIVGGAAAQAAGSVASSSPASAAYGNSPVSSSTPSYNGTAAASAKPAAYAGNVSPVGGNAVSGAGANAGGYGSPIGGNAVSGAGVNAGSNYGSGSNAVYGSGSGAGSDSYGSSGSSNVISGSSPVNIAGSDYSSNPDSIVVDILNDTTDSQPDYDGIVWVTVTVDICTTVTVTAYGNPTPAAAITTNAAAVTITAVQQRRHDGAHAHVARHAQGHADGHVHRAAHH